MITPDEMRKLEDAAEERGITRLRLMENAGKQLYKIIKNRYMISRKKTLVVCGSGNNGGDGLVLARYLYRGHYDVAVRALEPKTRNAQFNYLRLKDLADVFVDDMEGDIIVDALLGTGQQGELREPYLSLVQKINASGKTVISVDMPTGLGNKEQVKSDLIITFHDIKPGMELLKYKTVIADIGLHKA